MAILNRNASNCRGLCPLESSQRRKCQEGKQVRVWLSHDENIGVPAHKIDDVFVMRELEACAEPLRRPC